MERLAQIATDSRARVARRGRYLDLVVGVAIEREAVAVVGRARPRTAVPYVEGFAAPERRPRRVDGEHDLVGESRARRHVEAVGRSQRRRRRQDVGEPRHVTRPLVPAEPRGHTRDERDRGDDRREPDDRAAPATSRAHAEATACRPATARSFRRRRGRPARARPALRPPITQARRCGRRPNAAACRNAPSPPRPSTTIVARRVGTDGNASTASVPASAPAANPRMAGSPARSAAIAPMAPSAIAAGIATMRIGGATTRRDAGCGALTRRSPQPANRSAARPVRRRPRARASARACGRRQRAR